MPSSSFSEIENHIVRKLKKGLPAYMAYHNVAHTLDVLKHCLIIAAKENVNNADDIFLLKLSALYHDVGFLEVYTGHEEKSCMIAERELPGFGMSTAQINIICGMIRATKIAQHPETILEEIICDADLDYLGREDFFKTGKGLYQEFLQQQIVNNEKEWNELQIRFLENHHYFTKTSLSTREAQKQAHLATIKELMHKPGGGN
jgi:predicted metal-dependent HD superfamily phosphohydrolase